MPTLLKLACLFIVLRLYDKTGKSIYLIIDIHNYFRLRTVNYFL